MLMAIFLLEDCPREHLRQWQASRDEEDGWYQAREFEKRLAGRLQHGQFLCMQCGSCFMDAEALAEHDMTHGLNA